MTDASNLLGSTCPTRGKEILSVKVSWNSNGAYAVPGCGHGFIPVVLETDETRIVSEFDGSRRRMAAEIAALRQNIFQLQQEAGKLLAR